MEIRVLSLGEIVGKPGVYSVKSGLKQLCRDYQVDFVIANGEGTTGGFGIGKNHSIYLKKLGIDVITAGEKTFYKKDMVGSIQKTSFMLRPANFPPAVPGRGWRIYDIDVSRQPGGDAAGTAAMQKHTVRIGVINLLGQSDFSRTHLSNPFTFLPTLVEKIHETTPIIFLQFHAATTAEKQSMFFHADGNVSAVIGTHTKAITADARVFPKGTAVMTDNGRCGSMQSVGGLDPHIEIEKFLTQIPERSADAWGDLELQGAVITIDTETGKASGIEAVRRPVERTEQND